MINGPETVLITGATGSIGFALARRLSESGQTVRALVRNPARAAVLQGLANVEIAVGDLSRPDSLRGCMDGCALVYHCAAKLSGTDRAAFRAINVTGTQALLEEAARAGVERFVHLSTIGVYGFIASDAVHEDTPWPECNLPYIKTKQEAERAAWDAAGKVPVTVARLGDVIGPGQTTWTVGFIQKINRGLLNPPFHSSSGYINPVYIDNLIDALLLMGSHPAALGQIYNVVDGTPFLYSDYIRRLTKMASKRTIAVPVFVLKSGAFLLMSADRLRGREGSVTPDEVNYLLRKAVMRNDKICSSLGWKPAVNLEEGFRRTEEWLRGEGYIR